jgi:hypothetical protein
MNWTTHFRGMKIIESRFAVERKVKRRAVAIVVDVNRPNKVKPIYKMKTFVTEKPIAYLLKDQNTLIAHPDFLRAVQKKMGEQMQKSIDEQLRDIFTGGITK